MSSVLRGLARLPFVAAARRAFVIRRDARRALEGWSEADAGMLALYGRFLRAGDLCFDIGANLGTRVKVMRRLGCRVVAAEPQRECVRELRRWFGADKMVSVVPKAVGAERGTARLMTSNFHMISSLSEDWVRATRASGRFASQHWDKGRMVEVTTLDDLINEFGAPRFVKIDVEGFELEVLKGLSRPVPFLSVEFTPETCGTALECLERIDALGRARFNFSPGETMTLALDRWAGREEMADYLTGLAAAGDNWGDIYAAVDRSVEELPV